MHSVLLSVPEMSILAEIIILAAGIGGLAPAAGTEPFCGSSLLINQEVILQQGHSL